MTSKRILVFVLAVALSLAVAVTVGTFLKIDMTCVVAISAGWDALTLAAVGFYYWKAKNENRSKYAMRLVKELAREYGMENVVSLANTVLKD